MRMSEGLYLCFTPQMLLTFNFSSRAPRLVPVTYGHINSSRNVFSHPNGIVHLLHDNTSTSLKPEVTREMQSQNGCRKNPGSNYKPDRQELAEIEQSHAG